MGAVRRLWMELATALGLRRAGFFIPYRYAHTVEPPAESAAYAALSGLLHSREEAFLGVIAVISKYADDLGMIGSEPPPAPRWDQDWFPRLDAAAAYVLVRENAPARIVEVGCGHSTRFLARAVADSGHRTSITAIDPGEGERLGGLPVEWLRATVQAVGFVPFAALKTEDVLSIDSSHILKLGGDVQYEFLEILPRLKEGVLIHVHDIFLPAEYPKSWVLKDLAFYNEQYLLQAFLAFNHSFEVVWAGSFMHLRHADKLEAAFSSYKRNETWPGSFWIRKIR